MGNIEDKKEWECNTCFDAYTDCPDCTPNKQKDDRYNKLKPCPFCGGIAKEEQTRGSFGGYHLTTIYCQQCGASASDKETWNKRQLEN